MAAQIAPGLSAEIAAPLQAQIHALEARLGEIDARQEQWPALPILAPTLSAETPFLTNSTCAAADMTHPRYHEICTLLHDRPKWHRKQWEWVFIVHHLLKASAIKPGARGLGFGVGLESLPALFASYGAEVVATDAPIDDHGWHESGQHSSSRDHLRAPWMVNDAEFDRLVSHRPADMKAIPADLADFDFTWSSCCFEHLGSLQAGMDFVVNSVNCLRPGGIAVHTTEYNVVSNDETIAEGDTVVYRRRDLESLVERLRDMGHHPEPFLVSPGGHVMDGHVDAPPYSTPHLKLQLAGQVCTSAGIVVHAGNG